MSYSLFRASLIERELLVGKWEALVGCPSQEPRELGTIVRRAWTEDAGGLWEHRERLGSVAVCPKCGQEVDCLADTDQWTEDEHCPHIWRHDGYGPDMGECCDLLLAETDFEGGFAAFDLRPIEERR